MAWMCLVLGTVGCEVVCDVDGCAFEGREGGVVEVYGVAG